MPNYEANYKQLKNKIIKINLKGFLDAHTASDFEDLLSKLIDEGNIKFIIDLEELDYISSTGLGVFMGYIEQIRDEGGDIKFINVPKNIYKIFSVLGFSTIYEIYDDKESAVKNFD